MNQIAAAIPTPFTTIQISPPVGFGIAPGIALNNILSNAIMIVFIIATLLVLFMLIIGAIQWILSGGEKEKVANARGRITNALIGFAILALAFLIVNVVGQVLGVNVLQNFQLPTLSGEALPTPKPG